MQEAVQRMDSHKSLRVVRTQTIGECWLRCIRNVLDYGERHHDQDVELLEVLGLALEIERPAESDPIIDAYSDKTVLARTLAKFAKGASMPDRPFTYGERIYDMMGVDQFEWIVSRLERMRETKSATIGLLIPGSSSPNLPCLTTIDVKIRKDNLDLQFFFRSQNIFGRQYANLAALARLQFDLAMRCGAAPGMLRGYVASAHIYEFDLEEAHRISRGDMLRISDKYYSSGPASVRSQA
ncbi:thymidylate synthase [Thioalkalivibrio sp. XN279]|uniref:thymidylate synthase n=1 Tax=Thioalkalivibrio sp. XN279 TaxID=2714953 RepID=UPI00140A1F4F|nr:thymidylate synthase [Thioalkalivibrio sp. XN279]NHA14614.1 hypothetical protein [Thioalkalivibrio sp. XN279]